MHPDIVLAFVAYMLASYGAHRMLEKMGAGDTTKLFGSTIPTFLVFVGVMYLIP